LTQSIVHERHYSGLLFIQEIQQDLAIMDNLTTEEIKEIFKSFVINSFIKEENIDLDDDFSFIEQGIVDSVGVLELVAFIETTFHFRVEDEELVPENLDSINKLLNYVQSKLIKKSVQA
jgi:acyl carrier protein